MRLFYTGIYANEEAQREQAQDGLFTSLRSNTNNDNLEVESFTIGETTDISKPFYISIWLYIPSSAGGRDVYLVKSTGGETQVGFNDSSSSGTDNYIEFRQETHGGTDYVLRHSETKASGVDVVPYDEWFNLCITGEPNTNGYMYINGIEVASAYIFYNLFNFGSPLIFGGLGSSYTSYVDYACFNGSESARLTETQVNELIGDDGQGGLACVAYGGMSNELKALTDASVSMLQGVPYDGSGDKDITGNYTVDNELPFTGNQIYAINEAGSSTQLYDVDSLKWTGTEASNDYVQVTGSETGFSAGANDFTFVIRAQLGATAVNTHTSRLFGKYSGLAFAQQSFVCSVYNGVFNFLSINNGSNQKTVSFVPTEPLDYWYNIAISRRGDTMYLYKDGAEVDSVGVTGLIMNDNANPLLIGELNSYAPQQGSGTQTLSFFGYINNRGLTEQEINNLSDANGNPKCFNNIDSDVASDFKVFYDLGEWTGNTGNGLVNQANQGTNDAYFNLGGSTQLNYVDEGLQVEC